MYACIQLCTYMHKYKRINIYTKTFNVIKANISLSLYLKGGGVIINTYSRKMMAKETHTKCLGHCKFFSLMDVGMI